MSWASASGPADQPATRPGRLPGVALPRPADLEQGRLEPKATSLAEGWEAVRRGDMRAARSAFDAATKAAPRNASAWLGLATVHTRLWHDAEATTAVRQALALDPNSIPAHVLMGDLLFRGDEAREALSHYQTAARLDPNDVAIQDRLMTVQRDIDYEAQLKSWRGRRFTVKYPRGERRAAERVMARLDLVARRVGRALQDHVGVRTVVLLHADAGFPTETDSPPWAGAIFDGRIHVALRLVNQGDDAVDRALAHEYSHAVVYRVGRGRVPGWLDEGLALYCEGGTRGWPSRIVAQHESEVRPLHALHGSLLGLPRCDAMVIYAESYDATVYLIQRFGLPAVARAITATAGPDEFATVFETVFKEPYHVFETAWAAAVRGSTP